MSPEVSQYLERKSRLSFVKERLPASDYLLKNITFSHYPLSSLVHSQSFYRNRHDTTPLHNNYNMSRPEYHDDPSYDDETEQFRDEPDQDNDERPIDYGQVVTADDPEKQEEEPRRQFKYSTADMHESSGCRKYCMIFMLFMFFFCIMIGLSMLFNWLFFDQEATDNGPAFPERPANETFPKDKLFIDQVCSLGTFDADEGSRCREACEPQFFACCDPFGEFSEVYINSIAGNNTNATDGEGNPLTDDEDLQSCSLDQETRGCMSYAKCQALGGLIDPAPGTLPILCAVEGLDRDRESCEAACRRARCCWADPGSNCLAKNFDICMDYAPCQNLRNSDDFIVETAPDDLDRACLYELPECYETCAEAECCGDRDSNCFRNNFMACLTYAPCSALTLPNVTIAPMYSYLPEPPEDLKFACNKDREPILEPVQSTCKELCIQSDCCHDEDPTKNCFHDDPLGCIQWEHQCQMNAQDNE